MNEERMWHARIETPNGRWLRADFEAEEYMEAWIMRMLAVARVKYGEHESFPVRIEEWTL